MRLRVLISADNLCVGCLRRRSTHLVAALVGVDSLWLAWIKDKTGTEQQLTAVPVHKESRLFLLQTDLKGTPMNRLFRYAMIVVAIVASAAASAAADDRGDCNNARGDGAIVACSRLIANSPKDAVAYNNRGLAHYREGNYDLAIADYDHAIEFNPRYVLAYGNRGLVYTDKGDHYRAIADLDQAIRLDPKYARAYNNRGLTYYRKGDCDRAIADYDHAIEFDPKYVPAYSNRGLAYTDKGDNERAIADLDRAIGLDPKYARAYNIRGLTYYRKGDYDRAIADHLQAVKLDPTLAIALQNRLKDQISQAAPVSEQVQVNPPIVQQYRPGSSSLIERRVALVIGNSEYRSVTFLPNPRRDAKAVAEALRQVGFQTVELAMDLDRDTMVKTLRSFRDQADKADWALIYFAGHGIEINRVNYLIPIDAKLADDRDVKAETVSYEELLSAIGGAKALRLIILDACRVNPFRDTMSRTIASRGSTERGLARPPESEPGTLVVYSAKDGEAAVDDVDGVNSPFARAFVAELKVPGREVRRLFDYVRDDVLEATNKRQQPFTYGSLPGRRDFFFLTPNQGKRLGIEVTMTDLNVALAAERLKHLEPVVPEASGLHFTPKAQPVLAPIKPARPDLLPKSIYTSDPKTLIAIKNKALKLDGVDGWARDASPDLIANAIAEQALTATKDKAVKQDGGESWIIQVGAFDVEREARERLNAVQAKAGQILKHASPFTEAVVTGDKTFYRARFAGTQKDQAEAICQQLKRNDIACMIIKN